MISGAAADASGGSWHQTMRACWNASLAHNSNSNPNPKLPSHHRAGSPIEFYSCPTLIFELSRWVACWVKRSCAALYNGFSELMRDWLQASHSAIAISNVVLNVGVLSIVSHNARNLGRCVSKAVPLPYLTHLILRE